LLENDDKINWNPDFPRTRISYRIKHEDQPKFDDIWNADSLSERSVNSLFLV